MDDDILIIDDEASIAESAIGTEDAWVILIVDDDPLVHEITRFALDDFQFEGRGLEFISAHSGDEARQILGQRQDIAVILLDVVMESDVAGLELARYIREDIKNHFVRIILRTGQPGQAPERDVIVNYDINDYKAKSELTAQKLFTTVLSSLRAYNQIVAIEMNRQGLEKILDASSSLYEQRSLGKFVDGVVLQIRSIINDTEGALLCAVSSRHFSGDIDDVKVVAGVAPFEFRRGVPIRATLPETVCHEIATTLAEERSYYAEDHCVIFFKTVDQAASVIYLCGHRPLTLLDRRLLEVFCSKVAIGFDNAYLFERIVYEKTHDGLTGLLTRAAFNERFDEIVKDGPLPEMTLAVVDCDRFRDVNAALGYEAGDRFLRSLAERINTVLGPGDLMARLGGDQFVILRRTTHATAVAWAERLMATLTLPMIFGDREVIPSAAAGLAQVTKGRRAEDFVADAERAMRKAKLLGGGRFEIAAGPEPVHDEGRLLLVTQLIHAIRLNQFEVFYQPIVTAADAEPIGFEALIRWRHPERGLLAPGAFIGLVEATGLIVPIGSWVLDQAARQLAAWDGYPKAKDMRVAINVSARQFLSHDLAGDVGRVLQETGIAPDRLTVEVTESLIMTDPEQARTALTRLKDMGVRLSLDDFGTGYSSLSYLDRFPFDVLKIDRSFVQAMLKRKETMAVVRAIVALAHELGLEVVGEGVEQKAEAEALAALGCRWCQGYLFGRPMSAEDAALFISRAAG